jgi:hypothetical protein
MIVVACYVGAVAVSGVAVVWSFIGSSRTMDSSGARREIVARQIEDIDFDFQNT